MFIIFFIASDVRSKMFFSFNILSLVWIFIFYSNPAKHTYCQQVIVAFALKIIRFGSIRISKIIMCPKA